MQACVNNLIQHFYTYFLARSFIIFILYFLDLILCKNIIC